MHFVTCPKQGREMEAVVLHRVGFLAYPCPKQGQDFKPSAAPLYPNMGQVPPPPGIFPSGAAVKLKIKHMSSPSTAQIKAFCMKFMKEEHVIGQ